MLDFAPLRKTSNFPQYSSSFANTTSSPQPLGTLNACVAMGFIIPVHRRFTQDITQRIGLLAILAGRVPIVPKGGFNPLAGMPISVWIVDARHPFVFIRTIEQVSRFADDAANVGAYQLHRAGLHRFRTFGFLP